MNSEKRKVFTNGVVLGRTNSAYKISVFLLAFLLSLLLASFPVDAFYDRVNYLAYADRAIVILVRYLNISLLSVLANEPVWLALNVLLSVFNDAETTVRIFIFFSTFFLSVHVLLYRPRYFFLLLMFILLPQVLKNNIVHLRQGVAISFFLIGYFSKNKFVKASFLLLSPLVHASFFFILFFYFVDKTFHRLRLAADVRALVIVFFGVFVSFFGIYVAGVLGARQGGSESYIGADMHGIGLGFIFWVGMLCIYLSAGRAFLREQSLAMAILLFYLSTYLFFPVSARVFESGLILVLLSGLALKGSRFMLFILLFSAYFIIQWGGRLNMPYFGWQ